MARPIQTEDRYQPVAFDPKAHAAEKRKTDPAFRAAYDALEDEFAALAALLQQNPALARLRAVREKRVLLVDPTLLTGGLGPRLPDQLAVLSAAFYPASLPDVAEARQP